MPFLLALMAQTVTLNANSFEAAKTCARVAVLAHSDKKSQMELTSQYTFYVMNAALAQPAGEPFFTRLEKLAGEAASGPTITPGDAAALAPQCERRFALPAPTATPQLPADPFQRDVLCFGSLSLLQGAAQQFKEDSGDGGPLEKIDAVLQPLLGKMTDEALTAKGVGTDEKFMKLMGDQMTAAMKIGEPIVIARGCGVTGI